MHLVAVCNPDKTKNHLGFKHQLRGLLGLGPLGCINFLLLVDINKIKLRR